MGGGAQLSSRDGLRPSIAFTGYYAVPFQSDASLVGSYANLVSLRVTPAIELIHASWFALDVGVMGGVDVLSVQPHSAILPSTNLGPTTSRVDPIVGGAVTARAALASSVVFVLAVNVDVNLASRRYVLDDGSSQVDVFEPWRVRPTVLAGSRLHGVRRGAVRSARRNAGVAMSASRCVTALSFAALAAVASTTPSCTQESIVLATLPATDAGSPPTPPARCVNSTTCAAGTFCSKTACSDATGTCELIPAVCDQQPENPVCGCDAITYYNDCLRQAASIAASTPDACRSDAFTPCTTDGSLPCPDPSAQKCAVLIGGGGKGQCPQDFPGTCWVVPQACPTTPDGTDRWDACNQSQYCVDTCDAIASGQPFRRSNMCQPPPNP